MNSNIQPPVNAYTGNEPFLFVSYAHLDKKMVYPIIEDLYKKGARIWYDEGIPASSNWIEQIADTIINCTCFLVFITPRALESKNLRDEINYAKKKDKQMFIVYLEDTELPAELEFQIGSIQALFKHKMADDTFWKKLMNELSEIISQQEPEILKGLEIEKILDLPKMSEYDFQFLIAGNEEAQKPLLLQLFNISFEEIVWPPEEPSIFYKSVKYKMRFGIRKEYNLQVFFLSNIKKLIENHKLFWDVCGNSDGLIFFYNPRNQQEFEETSNLCIDLRNQFPELEIILTSGSEEISTPYAKLEKLEDKYQINSNDDYESVLSEMLINVLKKKNKLKRKKSFFQDELKKLQAQLQDGNLVLDDMVKDINKLSKKYGKKYSNLKDLDDKDLK